MWSRRAAKAQGDAAVQKITVNGAQLAYVEMGQGAPLLFVHGSLDDYRSWRLQMEPFAAHYHVFAYSRRYHYPNAWSGDGSDYSAQLHAEDLAAFIRGLGVGPVHLVTSSYGGNVALYMTEQQPALVRSIVLGEPPLLPWLEEIPGGAPLWAAFTTQIWLPARAAFAADQMEEGVRLFLDGVLGRPTFASLRPRGRAMLMDNAPEMQAETLSNRYFPPFTCADAQRLTQPVLLCKGELSPRLFHLVTDRLTACLPGARGPWIIPGASHAMHVANAAFYNEVVLAFLRAVEA